MHYNSKVLKLTQREILRVHHLFKAIYSNLLYIPLMSLMPLQSEKTLF
jgi:hypothetical protein